MHQANRSPVLRHVFARIRSLQQNRSMRDTSCQFWIEGIRNFIQAFDANHEFDTVIHSSVLLKSSLAEMLVRRLKNRGVGTIRVTPEQFRSICSTPRASGIGGIVKQHFIRLFRNSRAPG